MYVFFSKRRNFPLKSPHLLAWVAADEVSEVHSLINTKSAAKKKKSLSWNNLRGPDEQQKQEMELINYIMLCHRHKNIQFLFYGDKIK